MLKIVLISLLTLTGSARAAEPRSVTLGVEQMTCAACPITVRKALARVAGVAQSSVDAKAHTATITFDPDQTTPEALATAVSNAGYPAKVLHIGH